MKPPIRFRGTASPRHPLAEPRHSYREKLSTLAFAADGRYVPGADDGREDTHHQDRILATRFVAFGADGARQKDRRHHRRGVVPGQEPGRPPRRGRARRAHRRHRCQGAQSPPGSKTRVYEVDLTQPTAEERIGEILAAERVDTLVHLAFLASPTHARRGRTSSSRSARCTCSNAARQASVRKLVLWSQTLLYGAHPTNPNFLSERHPLRAPHDEPFFADKIEAEAEANRFAQRTGNLVTILRTAPIVGPTVKNYLSHYLARRLVPTMMGFDPLWQFLHEADAIAAFKLAIFRDVPGTFNIVGDGVLPLSTVIKLAGRVALPVPHPLVPPMVGALWVAQLSEAPPGFLDYLRYICVADGEKAAVEMGFRSRVHHARSAHRLHERAAPPRRAAAPRDPCLSSPWRPEAHQKAPDDAAKPSTGGRRRAPRSAAAARGLADGTAKSTRDSVIPSEPPPSSEYATSDAPREPTPTAPPDNGRVDEVATAPSATVDEVQDQIRKLELQLDRMIQKSKKKTTAPEGHADARRSRHRRKAQCPQRSRTTRRRRGWRDGRRARAALERLLPAPVGPHRDAQPSRRSRRVRPRPEVRGARWQPLFDFLYKHYFRVETAGASNIPSEGRCLVVANHSGHASLRRRRC